MATKESLLAWSILAKTPEVVFSPKHERHLVFWSGQILTLKYANVLLAEKNMLGAVSRKMRTIAFQDLQIANGMGILNQKDQKWISVSTPEDLLNFYSTACKLADDHPLDHYLRLWDKSQWHILED